MHEEDPFAMRTDLGLGIIGKLQDNIVADGSVHVRRTMAQEAVINNEKAANFFIIPNKSKEVINPQQVNRMFEQDFNDKQ